MGHDPSLGIYFPATAMAGLWQSFFSLLILPMAYYRVVWVFWLVVVFESLKWQFWEVTEEMIY